MLLAVCGGRAKRTRMAGGTTGGTACFCGGSLQTAALPVRRLRAATSPRRSRTRLRRPRPPTCAADPPERERPKPAQVDASKYAHLPADEAAEMVALDALAEEWIGGSIARWEWYERLKARRERLRTRVATQQELFDGQLAELKGVLLQLDAFFGLGLVDEATDRVTAVGWAVVAGVGCANFVVAYACLELANNAVVAAFPTPPW